MTHFRHNNHDLLVTILKQTILRIDVDDFEEKMRTHLAPVTGKTIHLHFDVKDMIVPSIPICLLFARAMHRLRPLFEQTCIDTMIHGATKSSQRMFTFLFTVYKPSTPVSFS